MIDSLIVILQCSVGLTGEFWAHVVTGFAFPKLMTPSAILGHKGAKHATGDRVILTYSRPSVFVTALS